MLYLAHLNADVVAEIKIDDEEDEASQEMDGCNSSHCQLVITGVLVHCPIMHCQAKCFQEWPFGLAHT